MSHDNVPAYGLWSLVVINSLVFIIFAFSFAKPQSSRDWRSFGAFSGFLVALFAEMYGFPLTIYLIARFTGLDQGYVSANLWATLLGVGPTGMLIAMIVGYALAFLGIGLFAQGWRQVYRARATGELVTDGLYRFVRHPQYTGLFVALFGEGVVHWPTLFSVGLFPLIVFAYYRLARREERRLIEEFGEAYRSYQRQVPMFIPMRGQWRGFIKTSSNEAAQTEDDQR